MSSIYSPTDYNPKILKSEGSTAANQRGSNNYTLIDPNPDMEIVPPEDLFIFVDLKARSRPKSLIQTTDEKTYSLTVLQGTVVSVGAGDQTENTIKAKQLFNGLTTDWTEIGGIGSIKAINSGDYDPQGFAITNIDISIKSQDAPKVVIDFVDVRGATLFEQGSCSPYGFFFQLPYPVFELTVKGYYGKAVTYYLNLLNFTTKFNSENGNFECRAEFVGYSFAFLSDILMGYIMAASFLSEKKYKFNEKLKNIYKSTVDYYNKTDSIKTGTNSAPLKIETFCPGGTCLTIFQVIKALRDFELKGGAGLKSDISYEKVQGLGIILNIYNSYRQTVEDLIISLNSYTKLTTTANNGLNRRRPIKIVFGKDEVGKNEMTKLLNTTNGLLYNFFNRIGGQAALKIKEIITEAGKEKSGIESGKINCLSSKPDAFKGTTTPYPLFDATNLIDKPWFGGGGVAVGSSLASLGYISTDQNNTEYYIDFGYILNSIDAEINYISEKIDIESDNYAGKIEEKIISVLKFSPTINSVFTILMANTEAFMEVLKEVSVKAEKYHEKEDLKNYTVNGGTSYVENTNTPSSTTNPKKVYSWPNYSVTEGSVIGLGEVEKYPGTNKNFYTESSPDKSWPEITFVEDFLRAFLSYQKSVEELFAPEVPYTGQPGQDNFIPINPLETRAWYKSGNGYFGKNSQPDILKTIGERLFVSLDHTIFNPIRFTRDAIKMRDPKENKNVVEKYSPVAAKLDANNLLNATKNTTNLNGWIPGDEAAFIDGVKKALGTDLNEVTADKITKIRNTDNIVVENTTTKSILYIEIPLTEIYYTYNPKDGILFKKDDKGNKISVYADPYLMGAANLVKLIKPEDVQKLEPISLSSENFKNYIKNDYITSIKDVTNNFGYGDANFKAIGLSDLVFFDDRSQQSLLFGNSVLFTTLAISSPIQNGTGPIDSKKLGGPANNSSGGLFSAIISGLFGGLFGGGTNTAAGDLGPMVSNMGMISYWTTANTTSASKPVNLDHQVVGVDLLFRNKRNTNIDEDNYFPKIKTLEDSLIFKSNNFYSPLVTTPMWLDNVIKFREKVNSGVALKNYDEPTQLKNLAYLFLHSLKPTPLFVRLISGNGVFASPKSDVFIFSDINITAWGFNNKAGISALPINKYDDITRLQTGVKSSIPWAITAFNNIGAISEVPKAWVLAFGSQLWRWRQFIGNKTGDVWKKTVICQLCKILPSYETNNKPNGNDPLIQPGFNSYTNNKRQTSKFDFHKGIFRNDIEYYLENIYDVKHKTNVNTKIPFSVFGDDAVNNSDNLKSTSEKGDSYGGFSLLFNDDDSNRKVGAFFYYALRENEMGRKLGDVNGLLEGISFDKVTINGYYSWPQTYIAPHHIPYISPDLTGIFAENSEYKKYVTGKGSDFVFLTDYFYQAQDYISIQPNTFKSNTVNKTEISNNKNVSDYGFCYRPYLELDPSIRPYGISDYYKNYFWTNTSRSKEADANLGMVFQYIPDGIKDLFAEEFETWATSQEWKDLLKTIDPIHFGESGADTLIAKGRYSYKKGTGSPSAINYENVDERVNISLDSDATKVLETFFNQKYFILNSTPKIWYGYQGDGSLGSIKNDPDYTNKFGNVDEKLGGFYVKKTDFDTYLKAFYTEYKAKLPDRIKELTGDGTTGEGTKKPTVDPLKDDDLKLSLYRTFKSLSEKWLQRTPDGTDLFFNIGGASSIYCDKNSKSKEKRTLASYFVYINRVWGDIGNKSVIDIRRLNEIKDNNKVSLYQMITDILTQNEYLFFALPTYINFTGRNGIQNEDLKDMFRPVLDLGDAGCGPLFVCMYVGGSSRKLDLQIGQQNCKIDNDNLKTILNNVKNDGFSLEDIQQPSDISSGDFTAFKLLYGKQNQNHFKNIQLDQSEFTETAESLAVLDRLAASQGTETTSKGQNLTSSYLTRSYTCSVEAMGNMMIQPMLYFDLQGIPMFSGAYLITDVNHKITPNNIKTLFKGVRQPRTVVPIVNSVAVAMKLVPQRKPVVRTVGTGAVGFGGSLTTEVTTSAGSLGLDNTGISLTKTIPILTKKGVLVCSHITSVEGGSPAQNQFSNIKKLIDSNIDMIEIDIRVTKDKVPVLFHDENIVGTTDGTGTVESKTWNELKVFRYKSDKNAGISRLDEVANYLRDSGKDTILQLDKTDNTELDTIIKLGIFKGIESQILQKGFSPNPPANVKKAGFKWMWIVNDKALRPINNMDSVNRIVKLATGLEFIELPFQGEDTLVLDGTLSRELSKINCRILTLSCSGPRNYRPRSLDGDNKTVWPTFIDPIGTGVIMTDRPIGLSNYLKTLKTA